MFNVNDKNRMFNCQVWTYFTPSSSVSLVDLKQVNIIWVWSKHSKDICRQRSVPFISLPVQVSRRRPKSTLKTPERRPFYFSKYCFKVSQVVKIFKIIILNIQICLFAGSVYSRPKWKVVWYEVLDEEFFLWLDKRYWYCYYCCKDFL